MSKRGSEWMKLLIHICCGPCAVYPVDVVKKEGIEFDGYFYNPNIHPIDEFERRMENVKILSDKENIRVYYDSEFLQSVWEEYTDKEKRCKMCYTKRLEKAAKFAKENNFTAFTTTLLVSPYQNHQFIKDLGENLANEYGIEFFYRDFRFGFREGQKKAKEMGLYRQKYCGCIKSKEYK